jgi:hypothetical protein
MAVIGSWDLSQRGRVERQEPPKGTLSPPLPDFIETNSNQPCPEAGFKAKLLEMGQRSKCCLLDNVVGVRVTAHGCLDYTQQRREVWRDQVGEEITPSPEDLANQSAFLNTGHVGRVYSKCHHWYSQELPANLAFVVAFAFSNRKSTTAVVSDRSEKVMSLTIHMFSVRGAIESPLSLVKIGGDLMPGW